MNENDQQQLQELKNEIREQSLLKKGPLLVNYLATKGISKIMPSIVQRNSNAIIDTVYKGTAYFFTMIFPLVYVYKRDENEEDDDLVDE